MQTVVSATACIFTLYLMSNQWLVRAALLFFLSFFSISNAIYSQCWELVYEAPSEGTIWDIYHFNDSLVWVGGQNNLLIFSSDSGGVWQEDLSPFTSSFGSIRAIWFHNPLEGIIGGTSGLQYTLDGGENWMEAIIYYADGTLANVNIRPWDIHFKNESEGWLTETANDNVLHTLDGGKTWVIQEQEELDILRDIVYTSGDTLYIRALNNASTYLYYTTNGGEEWLIKDISLNPFFAFFLNASLSWWSSCGNHVYKSEDFLDSFDTTIVSSIPADGHCPRYIDFANESLGWVPVEIATLIDGGGVENMGRMYVTTDGGASWQPQNPEIIQPRYLEVVNDSLAFVGTDNGQLYRYRGRPASCAPIPTTLSEATLLTTYAWSSAEGCFDGYYFQLGSTAGAEDLLPRIDVELDTFYQVAEILPENTEIYATVTPYNHVYGAAEACESSSFTTIICPPSPIVVDTGYCKGEFLLWGDSLISQPGQYTFVGQRENGCDSTVVVQVIQYEDAVTSIDTAYCQGDAFYWQDSLLVGTGEYHFDYLSATGCDSTVIVFLEELLPLGSQVDTLLCEGMPYIGQDTTLTEGGYYTFDYQSAAGCDSLVNVSLSYAPIYDLALDTFYCEGRTCMGMVCYSAQVYIFLIIQQHLAVTALGKYKWKRVIMYSHQ
jgi:photosystem II stability/assembly factor-like uncharacterized protein